MASDVNGPSWLLQIPKDVFMQNICFSINRKTFGILVRVCKTFYGYIWNHDFSREIFLENHRLYLMESCCQKIIYDIQKKMNFLVADTTWYASLKDISVYYAKTNTNIGLLVQIKNNPSTLSEEGNNIRERMCQDIEQEHAHYTLSRAVGEVSI